MVARSTGNDVNTSGRRNVITKTFHFCNLSTAKRKRKANLTLCIYTFYHVKCIFYEGLFNHGINLQMFKFTFGNKNNDQELYK